MQNGYARYDSPIGPIYVLVDEIGVFKVELFEKNWQDYLKLNPDLEENKKLCEPILIQLDEYFNGKRKIFDVPLHLEGTSFQKQVWKALTNISYGNICSYKDIAKEINNPKAVRAVGQANKANNLPIIIPCHRVIGKNKKLVGYAGHHTDIKEYLLNHEGINWKY